MSYQVIARRYRPQKFADLVGQEAVSSTLRNAVRLGRTSHAYLFTGPRGVGKTSAARILAKALRCENRAEDGEPCGKCSSCKGITEGSSLDVIEIDAASNTGVDNIRELRENVGYAASSGEYRVYIIDEVHMLSTAAFNALLKTLEEPPPHVVFVFATTELHKVLPTILSRCQRFDFRKVPVEAMIASLKAICAQEKVKVDDAALRTIAIESEGCLRDAQSLLDQAIAFCGTEITLKQIESSLGLLDRGSFFALCEAIGEHDPAAALKVATAALDRGNDPKVLLGRIVDFFADLHFRAFAGASRAHDEERDALMDRLIRKLSTDEIVRALDLSLRAQAGLQGAVHPALHVESLVVKLCLQRPALAAEASASASPVVVALPAASAPRPAPGVRVETPSVSRPSTAPSSAPAAPAPAVSASSAGHLATLEAHIRKSRPAWTPVLQSILSLDVEGDKVVARARGDFAGKRLASPDGHEVLKAAFGAKKAEVSVEGSAAATSPQSNFQEKKRLAKEHEAVVAAMKILDATIQETKVLEDEGPRGRSSGNQKGDK